MWNGQRVAVVLPTYNEHLSIADCIRGFEALGVVDDIVVVNNNAHPDTSAEVAGTSAREVHETVQGYGSAIRRGFAETGDAELVTRQLLADPRCTVDWLLSPADPSRCVAGTSRWQPGDASSMGKVAPAASAGSGLSQLSQRQMARGRAGSGWRFFSIAECSQ